ncbi:MAG: Gfo/Idh/MocA family oxidoreductase [Oribacterium sp.]|nr:Gfo/Idh/MocA family oxidoreductase [Oribacterium sp.]
MNLGIVGTGKIVVDALFAMQPVKDINLMSIFARPRSREKGVELAKKYGITEVFTDYDEMLDNGHVDTVYIGLVNMVHFEYAKKALEKDINVILEKPFVGNYQEAKELIDIAKEKGCFIFEAITVLHNDVILKMKEALPKLGRIRMMTANYSQYSSRYDRYLAGDVDPVFDPACLSGALRDINVYNIHYAAELFGRPEKVSYHPNRGFNGVDTSGTLVMEYDGFSAVCTGAKDSDSPCFLTVQGEKGYMKIDGKPNVAPNLTIVTVDDSGELVKDAAGAMTRKTIIEEFVPSETHHRMTREFIDFARIIDEKDYREWERYARETLDVMSVLDRC